MSDSASSGSHAPDALDRLEAAILRLLDDNAELREENRALHEQVRQLRTERATYRERNEQARHRVETMIARLRAMEQSE
ncbi:MULTISPECIES: cell division protein ZapB [unclassified Thioalkalivibrio]|uniref:cell division protein ZapB n=1 Tax=unclassified Thioalkalivibrio TaxID=2621013 RepID=UPI000372C77E|nr:MULTISPECIES: cell division protein ZapB [unclassified Thioalkalivibrio]